MTLMILCNWGWGAASLDVIISLGALCCTTTIEPSITGGSKPLLLQELVSAVGKWY
jgi:hypothetical protein